MQKIHDYIREEANKTRTGGQEAITKDAWQAIAKDVAFFEAVGRFNGRQHPKINPNR